jgi:D-alanyl-D-alanine carboxypeptidase
MEAASGKIMSAHNPDTLIYPASLTKMMTLYMVFDALRRGRWTLDTRLRVSRNASRRPASKLGLRSGSTITVRTAIQALIVKSANDVAVVVAEGLGRTEAHFARMMTRKARTLGMRSTKFYNASGLHHRGQVSTARDMAILARSLIYDWSAYFSYFSQRTFVYRRITYHTHNRLLTSYDGVDGLKTGYIAAAGYHLVATAIRNGSRIISVVIGESSSSARNQHMVALLDRAFAQVEQDRAEVIRSIDGRRLTSPARRVRSDDRRLTARTREIIQQIIEHSPLPSTDENNRALIIAEIVPTIKPNRTLR